MGATEKKRYVFPQRQFDDQSFEILKKWCADIRENKGDRAALRRAGTLTEVMFCPAFHSLLRDLRKEGYSIFKDYHLQKLAAIAGLAARVKTDMPGSLGKQFGTPINGEKAALSELRTRRLLACDDFEELYTLLRRALGVLDDVAPLTDLAAVVWNWMPLAEKKPNDSRRQLAYDYYAAAPLKKS